MEQRQLKYDAFISYRHCELDQFVAENLHKKLENFKLPKSVLPLLKGDKKKIERVFRDEDELPLSENLSDPIEKALDNSDFLIVICTPRLRESLWCKREIETFLKKHSRSQVLLVLAEGEPDQSFPEILTYEDIEVKDENGQSVIKRVSLEPLAADVRGSSRKEMLKNMNNAVIKLIAAIFSLNFDDVKQRHREQRIKKLISIWAAVSGAVFIFALVCLFLLARINRQNKELEDKYALAMAKAAETLLEDGRRKDAVYLVKSVLPEKRYINSESYRVLVDALSPYTVDDNYVSEKTFDIPAAVFNYCLSKDGSMILIEGVNGMSYLFDTDEGEELCNFKTVYIDNMLPVEDFDNNNGIIYNNYNEIIYKDIETEKETVLYDEYGYVLGCRAGDVTVVLTKNFYAGYKDGKCLYEENLEQYGINVFNFLSYDYDFSSDGKHLSLSMRGHDGRVLIMLINTESGLLETAFYIESKTSIFVGSDGNNIYVIRDGENDVSSEIVVYDGHTADIIGVATLPLTRIQDVMMIDTQLLIYSNVYALTVDISSLSVCGQLDYPGIIVGGFNFRNMPMAVDYSGKLYLFGNDNYYGTDITGSIFSNAPVKNVYHCLYGNNSFFYWFENANYVSMYSLNEFSSYDTTNNKKFDYSKELSEYKDASEDIDKLHNLEKDFVYSAIYSDDESMIAVLMYDNSLRIYNVESGNLIKEIDGASNKTFSSFVYIKEAGIYILNASPSAIILDEKFNYIADTDKVSGFEENSFIINKGGDTYIVPYYTYNEILKMADEYLKDYVPQKDILDKYGL